MFQTVICELAMNLIGTSWRNALAKGMTAFLKDVGLLIGEESLPREHKFFALMLLFGMKICHLYANIITR